MFTNISTYLAYTDKRCVTIFSPDSGFISNNCFLMVRHEMSKWYGSWHPDSNVSMYCSNSNSIIFFDNIKAASYYAPPPGNLTYIDICCDSKDVDVARKNRNLKQILFFSYSVGNVFEVIGPVK